MSFRSQKKTVCFYPRVCVIDSLHFHDHTITERAACWYTQKEKKLIHAERKKTLHLMKMLPEACKLDNEIICTRGLDDNVVAKSIAREVAMDAVLDEQEEQYHKGVYRPEQIAEVYSARSRSSVAHALQVGRADQRWVQEQEKSPEQRQLCSKKLSPLEPASRSTFLGRPTLSCKRLFLNPAA